MSTKNCSKCKIEHPIEMFGIINSKLKSGEIKKKSRTLCKPCENQVNKERRNKQKRPKTIK